MSNMTKQKKLTEYLSSVTLATTISRILGYIRDMLVAQIFGAGMFADAFYAAYRIPNLFRHGKIRYPVMVKKSIHPGHLLFLLIVTTLSIIRILYTKVGHFSTATWLKVGQISIVVHTYPLTMKIFKYRVLYIFCLS